MKKMSRKAVSAATASLALALTMGCSGLALAADAPALGAVAPDAAAETPIVGGWTIAESQLSADVQAVFEKAADQWVGMSFEPIALLGTQVVAGTNYAVLCVGTTVTPDPISGLKVVVIYEDLEGNATITKVTDVVNMLEDDPVDGEAVPADAPAMLAMVAPGTPGDPLPGGWADNDEFPVANIPADALDAFNDATSGLLGVNYEPVALLGTQVVAGTNYAFLAKATTVTAEPVTSLKVIIVFHDLQGNFSIRNICDLDAANFTMAEEAEEAPQGEALAGGWTVNAELEAVELPEDAQAAFDKAFEGFAGVGYQPIALLGTQVVAGTNYSVLCKATTVTLNPIVKLAVVTIYADLDGGAQILNIADFNIGDFNI